MQIEITMPKLYKGYLIVGVAVEAPRLKAWKLRAIILSISGRQLIQLEQKQLSFWDKRTAQYYALRICHYYIDKYGSELDRSLKTPRRRSPRKK